MEHGCVYVQFRFEASSKVHHGNFFYPNGDERTAFLLEEGFYWILSTFICVYFVSSGRFGHFSVMELVPVTLIRWLCLLAVRCAINVSCGFLLS